MRSPVDFVYGDSLERMVVETTHTRHVVYHAAEFQSDQSKVYPLWRAPQLMHSVI